MPNKIYFTPGPSQLYHSFQDHFKKALIEDIPSISHRSSKFIKVVQETSEALYELLAIPPDYHLFFLNSANEAWDRIIQNLVLNHSHHFVNGSFSAKFYDFAIQYKMKSTQTRVQDGATFTNLSIPEEAELIGITKNETSVGHSFTEVEIKQLREENPNKLIALDVVSASPAIPVDFAQVDTAYLSVQKAFGMPAGLGLWIVNETCIEKSMKLSAEKSTGSYRWLPNLKKFSIKYQTPETPNMIFIYILGKIAEDMIRYGIKRLQNDTLYKAALISELIDTHPQLEHFVDSIPHRSKSTIVAKANNQHHLLQELGKKGLIVGEGYDAHKTDHIRIANFPTHSKESVELLCDTLNKIV